MDQVKELRIWCLKTNSCIKTIDAHSEYIREIKLLNDNQVASCSYDKTTKIWDLTTGSCIKTLQSENAIQLFFFLIFFSLNKNPLLKTWRLQQKLT